MVAIKQVISHGGWQNSFQMFILSFFSRSYGEKKLVQSIKVLPANIKSMNPMQKYPNIIALLACTLNRVFLCF